MSARIRPVSAAAAVALLAVVSMGADTCPPPPPSGSGCSPDEAAACVSSGGVWNGATCTCCRAGAHEVHACEMGLGGTFDWLACECDVPCAHTSECDFGFECSGGACVESECHEADPTGGLPERACPEGLGCEYGDGVDFSHGNGYCVPLAATSPPA